MCVYIGIYLYVRYPRQCHLGCIPCSLTSWSLWLWSSSQSHQHRGARSFQSRPATLFEANVKRHFDGGSAVMEKLKTSKHVPKHTKSYTKNIPQMHPNISKKSKINTRYQAAAGPACPRPGPGTWHLPPATCHLSPVTCHLPP